MGSNLYVILYNATVLYNLEISVMKEFYVILQSLDIYLYTISGEFCRKDPLGENVVINSTPLAAYR